MDAYFATAGGAPALASPEVVTATPTAGQTRTDLSAPADSRDRTFWMTPAGTLATLTVTMPADATSRLGQFARLGTTQAVTALTLNGATVLNAPASMIVNDFFTFQKVAANTWARAL